MTFSITPSDRDDPRVVTLSGEFTLRNASEFWPRLLSVVDAGAADFEAELSGIDTLDGAGAALLVAARERVRERGGEFVFVGGGGDVERLLDVYTPRSVASKPEPHRLGIFTQVGAATWQLIAATRDALSFIGRLTVATGRAIRDPRSVDFAVLPSLMERAGADSVPIAVVINLLMGVILGIQSSIQLEAFGVGIYVADLVGKSVTRELAPMMTAIIVAGRSGAAYTAELGTMKVSEEIDALRTLGFDPLRTLVLPRALALALMLPLLVLLGDFVGGLGGLLVGVSMLDLTVIQYWHETESVVTVWDIFGGVIKASVFGVAIALIACQRGLATRGGAAGVGSSTTSAIVAILFTIIVLDALFAILYSILGI